MDSIPENSALLIDVLMLIDALLILIVVDIFMLVFMAVYNTLWWPKDETYYLTAAIIRCLKGL